LKRLFDRWVYIALGLVAALLVIDAAVAYRHTRQLHREALELSQSGAAVNSLDDLLSTIKDAETGQRGFLITGDAALERLLATVLAERS
jgi:CHASE3 domain sensor protein